MSDLRYTGEVKHCYFLVGIVKMFLNTIQSIKDFLVAIPRVTSELLAELKNPDIHSSAHPHLNIATMWFTAGNFIAVIFAVMLIAVISTVLSFMGAVTSDWFISHTNLVFGGTIAICMFIPTLCGIITSFWGIIKTCKRISTLGEGEVLKNISPEQKSLILIMKNLFRNCRSVNDGTRCKAV